MSDLTVISSDPPRQREGGTVVTIEPLALIAQAVERGTDVATIEKLIALSERMEATRARKAFDAAISAAKAEIPPILKDAVVDFKSKRDGSQTNYKHETLAQIARIVDPILSNHGLSYRFNTRQDGDRLFVTCILSHKDGHCETNMLSSKEDHSGNKNAIQAIGSSVTYLMRYTLKAALGLSVSNDDDGRGGANINADGWPDPASYEPPACVSDDQAEALHALAAEVSANVPVFLDYVSKRWRVDVPSLSDVPAGRFDEALAMLEKKRARP